MLLDDKRRRGDIGKQDALRKSQLKYIEHITTVMNNDAETPESSKDTRLGMFLSWILGFGNKAEILYPTRIKEACKALCREVLEQYGGEN